MDAINNLFSLLSSVLWGWPMVILLLGTHVFLTFRLRIPQRRLLTGIRLSVKKDKGAKGDVSQLGYNIGIGYDAMNQAIHDRFFVGEIDYIRYFE